MPWIIQYLCKKNDTFAPGPRAKKVKNCMAWAQWKKSLLPSQTVCIFSTEVLENCGHAGAVHFIRKFLIQRQAVYILYAHTKKLPSAHHNTPHNMEYFKSTNLQSQKTLHIFSFPVAAIKYTFTLETRSYCPYLGKELTCLDTRIPSPFSTQ